eukprot:346437-Pelagomonas_calceolata.AAC.1
MWCNCLAGWCGALAIAHCCELEAGSIKIPQSHSTLGSSERFEGTACCLESEEDKPGLSPTERVAL